MWHLQYRQGNKVYHAMPAVTVYCSITTGCGPGVFVFLSSGIVLVTHRIIVR